jgi:hypothetical protein
MADMQVPGCCIAARHDECALLLLLLLRMSSPWPTDPCQGVVCPNVVSVDQSNFPAHRLGPITFTEVNLGTLNPVYSPGDYPGGSSDPRAPTVRFAATFLGQSVAGTAITGRPTAPLTLNTTPGSQQAEVVFGDVTRTQELENADALGQPLAIRFSTPIAAVGVSLRG